jgi:peptidoglycan/xylan/chitin deacetylase (PgdA/CDA1 family)
MSPPASGGRSVNQLWRLRSALGPTGRRRVRIVGDALLAPVGSLHRVDGVESRYGLTFDDGPDPRWTPPLLDLLAERSITATFFLLTTRTRRYPDLVQRILAAGHEIGLHGDDHTRLTTLPLREASRRLKVAKAELDEAAQLSVRWFRPPFGAQSLSIYLAIRRLGMQVVVWGPHAEDWVEGTPAAVAARAQDWVSAGDLLLLHDGLEVPAGQPVPMFDREQMFRILLAELSDRGLDPSSVGELVAAGHPRRTAWFRP